MSRRVLLVLGIALLLVPLALGTGSISESNEPVDLYNITYKPVPQGLEYYPLVVFGDNRPSWTHYVEYPEAFYKIVDDMYTINPIAVIGTGDHVGEGRTTKYQELYRLLANLSNVWPVPGNHDLKWPGSMNTWHSMVGPDNYVVNRIPNWSIIFVNPLSYNVTVFNETLHMLFQQAIHPNRILVIHYPIYPWVDHNINYLTDGVEKQEILLNLINQYNVSLVLQGHWHGYAEKKVNNTLYVIVGASGAPLYSAPTDTDADLIATQLYGYATLLLYHNGTYKLAPIYVNHGELIVYDINDTTKIIVNTRYTMTRQPATIPVQLEATIENQTINIIGLVESGGPQAVILQNLEGENLTILVTPGFHNIEAYITGQDTGLSLSILPLSNETAQILLEQYQEQQNQTTSTITTTTQALEETMRETTSQITALEAGSQEETTTTTQYLEESATASQETRSLLTSTETIIAAAIVLAVIAFKLILSK
ncbi:MAG: metallophosphoesterase [Desulfurococcales archaeon]|nr:metallophosphoesterase [Desulfurococcales archaeon]